MTKFVGLDLSTKTGIVILDDTGFIHLQEEVNNKCDNPSGMRKHIYEITVAIKPGDVVMIEGFGYGSKQGFLLGGIGWGVRMALEGKNIPFSEVAPTIVKKFVTGTGKADKAKVAVGAYKRWGFENDSDNIIDAFVLAQIGRALQGHEKMTKAQEEALKKVKVEEIG